MAEAKVTTDHDKIRKWVEARGGRPARVKSTGRNGDPGILRVDYPGFSGEQSLETISWDKWFDAFDKDKLAFLFDESPRSRFSKLVSRAKVATPRRAGAAKRTTSKRTAGATGATRTTGKRSAAKRRARPGKVTSIGAKKKSATTSRKAPRAMAARIGKRPTTAKKRTATKKRAGAKRRSSSTTKRATSRR